MGWLFWVSLIVLVAGVILFMYGSVEVINHNSDKGTHKAAYWAGFALEIIGLVGLVYVVVKEGKQKYDEKGGIKGVYENWQNDRAYAAETKNLGKQYRMAQTDAAARTKLIATLEALNPPAVAPSTVAPA